MPLDEAGGNKEIVLSHSSGVFWYSQSLEMEILLFKSLDPFLATFIDSLTKVVCTCLKTVDKYFFCPWRSFSNAQKEQNWHVITYLTIPNNGPPYISLYISLYIHIYKQSFTRKPGQANCLPTFLKKVLLLEYLIPNVSNIATDATCFCLSSFI